MPETSPTHQYNDTKDDRDGGLEGLSDMLPAWGDAAEDVELPIIVVHLDEETAEHLGHEPDTYMMFGETEHGDVPDKDIDRVLDDVLERFRDDFPELATKDYDIPKQHYVVVAEAKLNYRRLESGGWRLNSYHFKVIENSEPETWDLPEQ